MKYDVVTIGAAVWDAYVKSNAFKVEKADTKGLENACFLLGDKIEIDAPVFMSGGGATNAAATFAHLGFKVGCIARVGKDYHAQTVIDDLEKHGVHTNLISKDAQKITGYSVLLTAKNGQRTAIVHRGASSHLSEKDMPKDLRASWFYVTSIGGNLKFVKKIIDFAAKHGIKVAWNPGSQELKAGISKLKPLISKVDVLSLNREEASDLTGVAFSDLRGIIKKLRVLTNGYAVITDGKNGTYATDQKNCFKAHPTDVPVVNATGSGDAFGSAFAAGLLNWDGDITNALRLGTLNAESVIQKVGAKAGILTRMPGTRKLGEIKVENFVIK